MLFNEKFAIGHINFNNGWITVDVNSDEYSDTENDCLSQLVRSYSRLLNSHEESIGMMQYKINGSPYDFVIQYGGLSELVIVVENMNQLDDTVKYIRQSLAEINQNMLWEETF